MLILKMTNAYCKEKIKEEILSQKLITLKLSHYSYFFKIYALKICIIYPKIFLKRYKMNLDSPPSPTPLLTLKYTPLHF